MGPGADGLDPRCPHHLLLAGTSRAHTHRGARLAAVGAVAALVVAWGVAQWDHVLPETLTVDGAAAPTATITAVLVAAVLAVVVIGPSLVLLFTLDQRGMLPDEGAPDEVAAMPTVSDG